MSVFINACRLFSALPSLTQFGRGRLSLGAISFYVLLLLFGPFRLLAFSLAGPHIRSANYRIVLLVTHVKMLEQSTAIAVFWADL